MVSYQKLSGAEAESCLREADVPEFQGFGISSPVQRICESPDSIIFDFKSVPFTNRPATVPDRSTNWST